MSSVPYSSARMPSLGQINNVSIDINTLADGHVIEYNQPTNTWENRAAAVPSPANEISQLDSSVIVTDTGANGLVNVTIDGTAEIAINAANGLNLLTSKLTIAGFDGDAGDILTSNGNTCNWVAPAGGATNTTNDLSVLGLHLAQINATPAYSLVNMFLDGYTDATGIASNTNAPYADAGFVSTINVSSTTFTPLASGVNNGQSITVGADAAGNANSRFTSSASGSGWFVLNLDAAQQAGEFTIIATNIQSGGGGGPNFFFGPCKNVAAAGGYAGNSTTAYGSIGGSASSPGDKLKIVYNTVASENVLTASLDSGSGYVAVTPTYNADFTSTALTDLYWFFGCWKDSGNDWIIDLNATNAVSTSSATGNYISVAKTALASVSKVGIILLYKNHVGTATLNTDLVAEVSADGGANYTTAVLVTSGAYSSAGLIQVIANDIAVTSGTSILYRVSFANQLLSSKETRVYGASLLY